MRASMTARANFSGSLLKPGASRSISHGMAISASTVKATSRTRKAGKRLAGKDPRGVRSVGVKALGEERDEGRIESAFGKQPAEHVGDAESDEEGVGHVRGAEHGGNQDVAREAEHTAYDGDRADGGKAAIELHALKPGRAEARGAPRAPSSGVRGWRPRGSCS